MDNILSSSINRSETLKANIYAISSDTRQLGPYIIIISHCTTLQYNHRSRIIIPFDTVLRQKGNLEHEK